MTPEQFIAKLSGLAPEFAELAKQAPVVKGQVILDLILDRVFAKNNATDGKKIGRYKKGPYKAMKAKRSLSGKADYVDLQNTQELLFSFNWGTQQGKLTLGITNSNRAKVSEYLEQKYGRAIFTPSAKEVEVAVDEMTAYVRERLKQYMSR